MLKILLTIYLIFQAKSALSQTRQLQESSDEDIIILHINDVHCGVNDTIGYDGFYLYREELKRNYSNVITVDVGDHIEGGVLGSISDGSAIIEIMNEVGFDVTNLGNHEFDYGVEQLMKLKQNISSNYISSNFCYKKNKTAVLDTYKIIEKGGKKIAFIGVLTPLAFTKTYLSTIKDSDGEAMYDFLTGNNTQELYDRVQSLINEARNEKKVDYVILLTHIGMDLEDYTSNELLSKLENVDAVLDAHTHLIYNTTSKDKNDKLIPIAQTGTKLPTIGKLTIKPNGTILSEIIRETPEPNNKTDAIQLTRGKKTVWISKKMNDFINSIYKKYESELNIKYGHTDYELVALPKNTTNAHLSYCRYQECPLGNLIADAFKEVGNANIAIVNGGTIKSGFDVGNITRAEIIEASPYFDEIVVNQISGQDILDMLEHGAKKCPNEEPGFPQCSGIKFDLNSGINSSVLTDAIGNFINITGPRRVSNVKVEMNGKWEDLDLNKIYNVSMNKFLAGGGNGYSMIAKYEIYNETLINDADGLAYYIKDILNGEIPKNYSELQGRINIYNGTETTANNTVVDTTVVETDTIVSNSTVTRNSTIMGYNARSRGGLSTGGIIAIIIPLAVVLLAVTVAALICSRKPVAPIQENQTVVTDSNQIVIPKNLNYP